MTPVEVLSRAEAQLDHLMHRVKDDQWAAPTPCEGWTVRQLVNHLVGEALWMPPLLAGLSPAEVGSRFDGDLLGSDPLGAWSSARDLTRTALPPEPSGAVHLAAGATPTSEYLWQIAADHLVHGWDLAVALGEDHRLDAESITAVAAWFAANEAAYRSAGAIGPRPELPSDAGPQAQLLAMFGRTWRPPDALTVVARFGTAFDAQDVDAVMAMMTPDCVFESTSPPDGVRYEGQAAVRDAWTAFFAGSEGTEFVTESCAALGDHVVAQWRYSWSGAAPGHVRGVDLFTVRDGLVAEKLSYVKG